MTKTIEQSNIDEKNRLDDKIKSELTDQLNSLIEQNSKLKDNFREETNRLKSEMEKLKMNLKVKENIIESINDSIVIKEAEVARLKARISLIERKNLIEEIETNDCC